MGADPIRVYGQGSIEVRATTVSGVEKGQVLVFHNVYYRPEAPLRLISDEKYWEAGLFLNGKKRTLYMEQPHYREIGKLEFHHGKRTFEYNPVVKTAYTTRRSAELPFSKATIESWHQRVGHVGNDVLEHLADNATGVVITDKERPFCEPCTLATANQEISRRPIPAASAPWEVAHLDIVPFKPTG